MPSESWYAVWTRSNAEELVAQQLASKGFHVFLPRTRGWSRRRGTRRLATSPMFPGYLFLRHQLDRTSYVEVLKARGVVRLLGEGWDRPAAIPAAEIESLSRVVDAEVPLSAHPYLRAGQRARITAGPLAGVEGVLVSNNPHKGVLVISITLLHRSVAVEVDCTLVSAA